MNIQNTTLVDLIYNFAVFPNFCGKACFSSYQPFHTANLTVC